MILYSYFLILFSFLGVSTLLSLHKVIIILSFHTAPLNSHISHAPFAVCQCMPADDDLDSVSSHPCSGLPWSPLTPTVNALHCSPDPTNVTSTSYSQVFGLDLHSSTWNLSFGTPYLLMTDSRPGGYALLFLDRWPCRPEHLPIIHLSTPTLSALIICPVLPVEPKLVPCLLTN